MSKHPVCFRLLLFFCFPLWLNAQAEYAISGIPDSLLKEAHRLVRLDQTVLTILDNGDAIMDQTYVVTILSESGEEANRYAGFESSFYKIKSLKGRLFDAMGKLVRSSKEEDIVSFGGTADYEFTDHKMKYLEMAYPQFPYTVEFKKKTLIKSLMGIQPAIVQPLGTAVEKWEYRMIAPRDYNFKWKARHIDLQPRISQESDRSIYVWETANLVARPAEPFHPYFYDSYAWLEFAPERVSFGEQQGDFKSWKSVGSFFYTLNNNREQLSPATIARVQALTAGKTTREKIAALYRVTQQECRYVSIQLGIGGWQTLEAQFVDQKKYGDCKALSNYTQALLKAAGIESWEATVFAGAHEAPEYDETIPDPLFNHMILYVPGEDMWLECTSKNNPAGYLGSFTADRFAMLLTPEGGRLVRTPVLLPADNFEQTKTLLQLREDGSAEIQSEALFGGERHEFYRNYAQEMSREDFEKWFTQDAPFGISSLHKLNMELNPELPQSRVHYQLNCQKYANVSGKRIFVPLTKTRPLKRSLPANETRKLDLKMRDAYLLRDTFTLLFPEGFQAENVSAGKKIDTEFGIYELQVEALTDRVKVCRTIEIRPLQVPAARYGEVRKFLLDAAKADAAQMVLIKKT